MATFEDIQKANNTIQTTDIRGKSYADVAQRVKAFRQVYPTGYIRTQMLSNEGGVCVFRAECGVGEFPLGTGTAYEKEGSSNINRTSYIENCETSAVGRALGFAGFGIDTSIASADEVQAAISQQEAMAQPPRARRAAQEPRRAQEAPKAADAPQEEEKPAEGQTGAAPGDLIDGPQLEALRITCEVNGINPERLAAQYRVSDITQMTNAQYENAMARIQKHVKAKKGEQ